MKVATIFQELTKQEGVSPDDLNSGIISTTTAQDNRTRRGAGKAIRFSIYGEGNEEHGFISISKNIGSSEEGMTTSKPVSVEAIPISIESANATVRTKLKEEIAKMHWREFEATFLPLVLEALGFSHVEITQPTRDGGKDAICEYQRGVVRSKAIVSAKHWKSKIGQGEVRSLRGTNSDADTAIIITSSTFTTDAQMEAQPAYNSRAVVLIDGDLIVDACLAQGIGVEKVLLPVLYEYRGIHLNIDDPLQVNGTEQRLHKQKK